jgi:hypothetical protein
MPNQPFLRRRLVVVYYLADFREMSFDGLFTWLDDGFVSEHSSLCAFPRMSFPHWVLADMKSPEVKPRYALGGV